MFFTLKKTVPLVLGATLLTCLLPNVVQAQGKAPGPTLKTDKENRITTLKPGQRLRIRTSNVTGRDFEGTLGETGDGFLHLIESHGEIRLDSLVTTDSNTYVFSGTGARYDSETDVISGMTSEQGKIIVPLSEVGLVHVTLLSRFGSSRGVFDSAAVRSRLKFGAGYPEERQIPVDSIAGLYVWHKTDKGALILMGALGGAAFGFMVGDMAYESQKDDFISFSREAHVIPMVILGGIAGALTFSMLAPDEHWEKVPIEKVEFGLTPPPNCLFGVSVAMKIPL